MPWIAGQDGPRLDEVCERFGMTRKQLLDDLQIIPLVGLPPYTPDTLIEVTIEGDRVWLRFADVFARPLRLTPEQRGPLVLRELHRERHVGRRAVLLRGDLLGGGDGVGIGVGDGGGGFHDP